MIEHIIILICYYYFLTLILLLQNDGYTHDVCKQIVFAWYHNGYIKQNLRGQGNCLISLEMRFKQVLNKGHIYMQSFSCLCVALYQVLWELQILKYGTVTQSLRYSLQSGVYVLSLTYLLFPVVSSLIRISQLENENSCTYKVSVYFKGDLMYVKSMGS